MLRLISASSSKPSKRVLEHLVWPIELIFPIRAQELCDLDNQHLTGSTYEPYVTPSVKEDSVVAKNEKLFRPSFHEKSSKIAR
jgi:hypothetical protein